MTTYTFHIDPGHGWLEVPFRDSLAVGLSHSDYSGYSYIKGATLYLEEDCDAPKFIAAYERDHGVAPSIREVMHNRDCFIRNLRGRTGA